MDRWQAMRVFVKVAETKGFAEAARRLHMSPPAVTRAIATLEETIGARLLVRTTRSVTLTDAGARFFEDCSRILADLAEAEASAAGSFATPTGALTITASVMFGHQYVLPIILDYLAEHPQVSIRTLFVDRMVNLVDEGVDLAVRIGNLPNSGFSALRVGAVRRVVCGSPGYLETNGEPATPADLADHSVIAATSAWASTEWRFGQDQKIIVHVHPRLYCNTNDAALQGAIKGFGLTRVLSYQAAPSLASGALRTVLSAYEEHPLPVHIVHPEGRHAPAKVRTFIDFAAERLRADRRIN
ncbi:LysR family transcriptional regulator [Caulobacter sp. FWC2]|uniref:LysR family transcriptional regulator n=1 Tax=Caulobacter sp. FWC2 TaxID=69664 RepID=UPI000C159CD6|nr:LysR family transcriptional regulator [Caulobacter sp. FWC2]PIB91872.1 LysR family transcriptional regulator [Caulobacter sp. FWC2]